MFHFQFTPIFYYFRHTSKKTDPKSKTSHGNRTTSASAGLVGSSHKKKSIFHRALSEQVQALPDLDTNKCKFSKCIEHIQMLKADNLRLLEENIAVKSELQILKIKLSEAVSADVTNIGDLSIHDDESFESLTADEIELALKDIDEDDWKELKSIPANKRNDSTYIRRCLEIIYKNIEAALGYRTVSRRSKKTGNQQVPDSKSKILTPMTPDKKDLITNLFRIRIQGLNISAALKQERLSETTFNRNLTNALSNAKRRIKTGNIL